MEVKEGETVTFYIVPSQALPREMVLEYAERALSAPIGGLAPGDPRIRQKILEDFALGDVEHIIGISGFPVYVTTNVTAVLNGRPFRDGGPPTLRDAVDRGDPTIRTVTFSAKRVGAFDVLWVDSGMDGAGTCGWGHKSLSSNTLRMLENLRQSQPETSENPEKPQNSPQMATKWQPGGYQEDYRFTATLGYNVGCFVRRHEERKGGPMAEASDPQGVPVYFANIVTSLLNVDEMTLEFRRFIKPHSELLKVTRGEAKVIPPATWEEMIQVEPVARVVLTFSAAKNLKTYLDETLPKIEEARKTGKPI